MIDREHHESSPDAVAAAARAPRDLVIILATIVVLAALSALTGAGEALLGFAETDAWINADVLLTLGVLVPIGALVFAVRRYREATRVAEALADLARLDSLTGLPNRRFLGDGFEQILRTARRSNARVGVLFVDLDGFKNVNDTHGHGTGDELMVTVAGRMRDALGPDDVLVRYGGDEFVAICPDLAGPSSAQRAARRILAAIEEPVEIADVTLRISGSVGIALSEPRCSRPEEVLRDADAAMYEAKHRGPGSYAMFDRGVSDRYTPSTAERRLRSALDNGEFRLYYEPMVSLWTKRLVGVEAVLRWSEPEAGLATPDEFMPALEETGLIVPIGDWVIQEVCRQSREWQERFPDRPPVNIKLNISARQLAQADFVERLEAAMETTGADPDRLCLEVNEGALVFDVTASWATLRSAKALGVSLALDDFGTGYSSLSYLRRFAVDLLTIDRTFVQGIGVSREDTTIAEHVIGMAKALGIVTVAEGVESEPQVEQLRSLACDLAQGPYFSQPQPPDVIETLLTEDGNTQEWRPPRPAESEAGSDSAAVVPVGRSDRDR